MATEATYQPNTQQISDTELNTFAKGLRGAVEESEKELVPALGPCQSDLKEFYVNIPVRDGHEIKAKVWQPASSSSARKEGWPLILLFHGGGFVAGSCDQLTRPGREFAREFQAVVVSAEYRRVPEHKHPQAMLDGLDIVQWISQRATTTLQANLSTAFIVGGYSAGGQLAAVIASEARSLPLSHPITGSFLCIPSLLPPELVPERHRPIFRSREENTTPYLNAEVMNKLVQVMGADITSPLFSPVSSASGLGGIPPTYFQLGRKDVLRDDGVVYEKMLNEAGVETKVDVHDGIGHESWTIWTDEKASTSRALIEKTLEGMRWLLKR